MKKMIFLLLLHILISPSFSQSNLRLNNYWEDTYYINPASIFAEYQYTISTAARSQWINFPGAPNTGFITATVRPYPRSRVQIGQFGLKAIYDEIGYTKFLNAAFSYSYSVKLKKDLLMNLGTAGNFQNISYDLAKRDFTTIGDPVTYNTLSNDWDFNPDIGVEFVGKSILIGASSQHFFSMFSHEDKFKTNTNFLYAMYRMRVKNPVSFEYGICGIQNEDLSQVELNVSGVFNRYNHSQLFKLSVSYRTGKELAFTYSMDLGKMNKELGNSCILACRYDYNFGDIRRHAFGSPEILLIYKFGILLDCKCQELYK